MTVLLDEVRAAWRSLRRAPGYALTAIATVALGIASVSMVYALVEAVLLEPLPLPDPSRVLAVHRQGLRDASLSLPDTIHLRERLPGLAAIATISNDFALDRVDGDEPQRIRAALVESDYFRVIGLPPLLGRLTDAGDDRPGAPPVVVLGERWWRQQFGADPQVLGRRLTLSGVDAEIVGVAAAASDIAEAGTELWAPIPPFAPWAPTSPGSNNFEVVARVRAKVDPGEARAQLAAASLGLAELRSNPDKRLDATAWQAYAGAPVREGLWLLLGAVGLLMALATANVAALVLVRATRRRSELALRHALGASGARVFRLLLTEGLLVAGLGAAAGLALAWLGFDLLRGQAQGTLPRLAGADIDASVLAVGVLAALLSALLSSALPALRLRSQAALARASGIGPARGATRTLGALILVEATLASALLGGAVLLARSFLALAALPLGFDPGGVIVAEVVLPEARYSEREPQSRAYAAMVESLAGQPGVRHAAMVVGPPLTAGQRIGHTLLVEGVELDDANARYRPFVGDYFRAAGMRVLAGRDIAKGDAHGERLAWVNEAFVRRYLAGRDPLGARVAWKPGEAGPPGAPHWMRVVGVVPDVRGDALRAEDAPAVYAPYLQRDAEWIRFGTLLARVEGDPAGFRPALAAAVRAGDPAIPLGEVATLRERGERALARDRLLLDLVGVFAALALLLGAQGVFGVVAFAVEQRRAEIGVRLALGARPGQAAATLLRAVLAPVCIGAVGGLMLVVLAGSSLSGLLYSVSASDPASLAAAGFALVGVAVLAAWLPARRARKVPVVQALQG